MKSIINKEKIKEISQRIAKLNPKGALSIMEVCGTHTHAIGKSGLRQLLPDNIRLISGPGCPVCVTHDWEIEAYLDLARREDVIITTFGDLLKVPGKNSCLSDARGQGAWVEVVYSPLEAIKLAEAYPNKEIIFLGVGFETTIPAIAMSIITAREKGISNFSVFPMHKVVPPALEALLTDDRVEIDGFILPGHVSTIIGLESYQFLSRRFHKGGVIAGFEPGDILEAVAMLLEQISGDKPDIQIQYRRGMVPQGNHVAQEVIKKVFVPADAWWRGLGLLPRSGLRIREEFGIFDAKRKFAVSEPNEMTGKVNAACACGDILKGIKLPTQCKLFGKACTPVNPVGPCMVSSEGTCAAYYRYTGYQGGLICYE